MKTNSLVKNSIFNVANTVIGILLPLVTSIYTSRILLPDGIGRYTYVLTVVSVFITFAALGLPNYGIKMIGREKDDPDRLSRTFSELFIVNAISSTVMIIGYVAFVLLFAKDSGDLLLYWVLGIQLFFAYFNVDWYFGGIERYDYLTVRSLVIRILSLIALIIFVKTKEDLLVYALIASLTTVLNDLIGFVAVKTPLRLKQLNLKRHIKPILFLSLTLIFSTIYSKVDVIMLKNLMGETSVGIYNNAHKIVNVAASACSAITVVFLPRISYLFDKDRREFDTLISKGLQFLYFMTIPACVGLVLLANDVIPVLYGDEFSASAPVMMVLSLLIVIQGVGGLINYQMVICTGKEAIFVPTTMVSMMINVTMNYLLIPKYQAIGAAAASILSESALNIFLFIYMYKTVGYNPKIRSLLKVLAATAVMAAELWFTRGLFDNAVVYCVFAIVSGFAVYLLTNLLLKNEVVFEAYQFLKNRKHPPEESDAI